MLTFGGMSPRVFLLCLLFPLYPLRAQQVEVLTFPELRERLETGGDTLTVVNFWATWCKPCVEELPGFLAVEDSLRQLPLRFLFLSFDFLREKDRALLDFINTRNIRSRILLFRSQGDNGWMEEVSPQWQGAIPATWFYRASDHLSRFHEGALQKDELLIRIKSYLP